MVQCTLQWSDEHSLTEGHRHRCPRPKLVNLLRLPLQVQHSFYTYMRYGRVKRYNISSAHSTWILATILRRGYLSIR